MTMSASSFIELFDWRSSYVLYAVLGFILYNSLRSPAPAKVPAMGPTFPGLSYLGAVEFMRDSVSILKQGCARYPGKFFQVALFDRWIVIAAGGSLVEELIRAPDDEISFEDASNEFVQAELFFGHELVSNPFHFDILRSRLTRNLASLFPEIKDEITVACDDEISFKGSEWTKVKAFESVSRIVSRVSNRIFVGSPLCRNPDHVDLTIQFAADAGVGAMIINLFPDLLKPLVAKYLTNVPRAIRRGVKHYKPIIEARRGMDKDDRPNDFLTWLMENESGKGESPELLTRRILVMNFAAIHGSSISLTHALYHLAAKSDKYMQPLRDEIKDIVAQDGWTKLAMGKMRKLDSFMKESQRISGSTTIGVGRKTRKGYTFSDGTFVPKNTLIVAPVSSIHTDSDVYGPDADTFNGFRFAEMRSQEGEEIKHQMVTTSTNYLPFGHGRHACPGRFFATNVLKCLMAHLVMTYDIKLENGGVRPKDIWVGFSCLPNKTAEVMFRKRQ